MRTSGSSSDHESFNKEMKKRVSAPKPQKFSNGCIRDNVDLLLDVEVTESSYRNMSREQCPSMKKNDFVKVTIKEGLMNFTPLSSKTMSAVDEGRNSKAISHFQGHNYNRDLYECQNETFAEDGQQNVPLFKVDRKGGLCREESLKTSIRDEDENHKGMLHLPNRSRHLECHKGGNDKIFDIEQMNGLFRGNSSKTLATTDEDENPYKRQNQKFAKDEQQNVPLFDLDKRGDVHSEQSLITLSRTNKDKNNEYVRNLPNRSCHLKSYKDENGRIFNIRQINEIFREHSSETLGTTNGEKNTKATKHLQECNPRQRQNGTLIEGKLQNGRLLIVEEIGDHSSRNSSKTSSMMNENENPKDVRNRQNCSCHHNPYKRRNENFPQDKLQNGKIFNVDEISDLFREYSLKTSSITDEDEYPISIKNLRNCGCPYDISNHQNEKILKDLRQNQKLFNVEEICDLFREHLLKASSTSELRENPKGIHHLQNRRCHHNLYKNQNKSFMQNVQQNKKMFNVEDICDILRELPQQEWMINRKVQSKPYCTSAKGDHCQQSGITANVPHGQHVVEFLKTYIQTCNSGCEIKSENFRNDALVYHVHVEKSPKRQDHPVIELGVVHRILDFLKPHEFSKCNSSKAIIEQLQKLVADWASDEKNIEDLLSHDRTLTKCEKCGVINCTQSSGTVDFRSANIETSYANDSPQNAILENLDSNFVRNDGELLRSEYSIKGNTFESLDNETNVRRYSNSDMDKYTANENMQSLTFNEQPRVEIICPNGSTMTAERESDSALNGVKDSDCNERNTNKSLMMAPNVNQYNTARSKDLFCSDEFFRSSLRTSSNKPTLQTWKTKVPRKLQDKREKNNSKNEQQQQISGKTGQVGKAQIYDARKTKDIKRNPNQRNTSLRRCENKCEGEKKCGDPLKKFVAHEDEVERKDIKSEDEVSALKNTKNYFIQEELPSEVIETKKHIFSQFVQWKESENSVLHGSHDDAPQPESPFFPWENQKPLPENFEKRMNDNFPLNNEHKHLFNDTPKHFSVKEVSSECERKNAESPKEGNTIKEHSVAFSDSDLKNRKTRMVSVEKCFSKGEEHSTDTGSENCSEELGKCRESETTAYSSSSAENMILEWTKPAASNFNCSSKELINIIKKRITEAAGKCVNYSVISEDKLYNCEKFGPPGSSSGLGETTGNEQYAHSRESNCEDIFDDGAVHSGLELKRVKNSAIKIDSESAVSKGIKRKENFDRFSSESIPDFEEINSREGHSTIVTNEEEFKGFGSEDDETKISLKSEGSNIKIERVEKGARSIEKDNLLNFQTKNKTTSQTVDTVADTNLGSCIIKSYCMNNSREKLSQQYKGLNRKEEQENLKTKTIEKYNSDTIEVSEKSTPQIVKQVADHIWGDHKMRSDCEWSQKHEGSNINVSRAGSGRKIIRNDQTHDSRMLKQVADKIWNDYKLKTDLPSVFADGEDSWSRKCERSSTKFERVNEEPKTIKNDSVLDSQAEKKKNSQMVDKVSENSLANIITKSECMDSSRGKFLQKHKGSNRKDEPKNLGTKVIEQNSYDTLEASDKNTSQILKEAPGQVGGENTRSDCKWSQKCEGSNTNVDRVDSETKIIRNDSFYNARMVIEVAEQIWGDHKINTNILGRAFSEKRVPKKQQYLLMSAPTTNMDCTNDTIEVTHKNLRTLLSSSSMDISERNINKQNHHTNSKSRTRLCNNLQNHESETFERQITYDNISSRDISTGSRRETKLEESSILSIYRKILESSDEMDWETFQKLVETLHPSQRELWSDICKAVSNEAKRIAGETGASTEVCIEINPIPPGEVLLKAERSKVKASGDEISFEMDMVLGDVGTFFGNKLSTLKNSKNFCEPENH